MRQIASMPWGKRGWLPTLDAISWPTLDRAREEHEDAVAALAKARSDKAREEATERLLRVVEDAVRDLFATVDSAGPDGWRRSYREGVASLDRFEAGLKLVPVGGPALDAWIEDAGDPDLVEAARLRQALRADADRVKEMRSGVLGPDQFLRNGAILRRVECEVAEARDALTAQAEPEASAA